jgi:hypothetical protein
MSDKLFNTILFGLLVAGLIVVVMLIKLRVDMAKEHQNNVNYKQTNK